MVIDIICLMIWIFNFIESIITDNKRILKINAIIGSLVSALWFLTLVLE